MFEIFRGKVANMKTVLLVDDDESARIFVQFALMRIEPVHLRYLEDGFQAMRYLEGYGECSDRSSHPFPNLVLLDLKMPGIDGFEVLEWARAQPALGQLPIVVLTGSMYQDDITRAFKLGATALVTKVVDLVEFEEAVKDVVEGLLVGSAAPPRVSADLAKAA
jgi:CheY-like chemotaxis protein